MSIGAQVRSIVVLSALAVSSIAAHASPITFTETVTASGSLDGSSFADKLVTITGIGDTTNVTSSGSIYFLALNSATVRVGLTVDAFTGTLDVFDNTTADVAGFTLIGDEDILDITGVPTFATYALSSAVSEAGNTTFNPNAAFPTTGGSFDLTSFDTVTTFSAAVGTAATPEPSSFALLGTGLLAVTNMARRRLRAS